MARNDQLGMAGKAAVASMAEAEASLRSLERQDWWRWGSVAAVTLLLTVGVFALSMPVLKREYLDQTRLELAVSGLFALVLLFDIFGLYQQTIIVRLRRQLSSQLGMAATLEMLQPPSVQEQVPQPAREFQRFHFDQRVAVQTTVDKRPIVIHGRTSDFGDGGVGAVIPQPLDLGTEVMLEVNLGAGGNKLVAPAMVRYRRGFHHGFEFTAITPGQLEAIRCACDGALPFFDLRDRGTTPARGANQARR